MKLIMSDSYTVQINTTSGQWSDDKEKPFSWSSGEGLIKAHVDRMVYIPAPEDAIAEFFINLKNTVEAQAQADGLYWAIQAEFSPGEFVEISSWVDHRLYEVPVRGPRYTVKVAKEIK